MNENIVIGTCDGTGAVINVCLGFIPRFVMIINMEDAGSKLPVAYWMDAFAVISALDEGFKETGLSDTDFDRTVLAASGIAAYAGGDEINYDGVTNNRWENAAAADVEEVYVNGHYRRTSGSAAAYQCIGDAIIGSAAPRNGATVKTTPGFTIGADADLNADGEQLAWMAIR